MKFKELYLKIKNKFKTRNASPAGLAEKTVVFPEAQINTAFEWTGLVMRAFVVFAGVLGLTMMLFDAALIYNPDADFRTFTLPLYVMIIFSALFSILSVLTSVNKATKISVPLSAAALILILVQICYGNAFKFFSDAVRKLYNDILYSISLSGYTSLSLYMYNDKYSYDKDTLVIWYTLLLTAALSFILYFAVVKKARLWLTALTVAVFTVPVLSMNLTHRNGGIALVVAFICGFLAVRAYEGRYLGRYGRAAKRRRERIRVKAEKRKEKAERKILILKIKNASERVFDAAIESEMGRRRAKNASKEVYKRCIGELKRKFRVEKAQKAKARRQEKKTDSKNSFRAVKCDYKSKAELHVSQRRVRAAGGFVGAGALLVALLAVWIPAMCASKPFRTIEPIDNEVSKIRRSVTNMMMGDDVNLTASSGYLYGDYEKFGYEELSFEPREYENILIFKAESGRKVPVYLKSRSALNFNFSKDSWSFADSRFVMKYNERFGKGFSPDSITSTAYSYLYPSSAAVPSYAGGADFSDFGFYVQKISLSRINGDSKLFFTPSVINKSLGIFVKGGNIQSANRVAAYFDGVYTSHYFGTDSEGYGAVAFLHNMKDADIGDILDDESRLISLVYSFGKRLENGESREALIDEYNSVSADMKIKSTLGDDYLSSMTESERDDFTAFAEKELKYREYAAETYGTPSGNEKIAALAADILSKAETQKGAPLSVYEKVSAVRDYLSGDEFSYSLTPAGGKEGAEVLETFLFETKEGYCSHFATAAAMLLRDMGVSVRYCEGYIANDWYVNYGTQAVERYRSDVTDSDSHTWIEVYHDGIGWINYEVTKPYIESMRAQSDEKDFDEMTENELREEEREKPDEKPHYNDDDVVITPEDYISEDEANRLHALEILKAVLIAGGIIFFASAVISVVVKIADRRAKKEITRRYSLAADARNEAKYKDFRVDKREIASQIINSLFEILNACGIGPEKGEQLSAYAERMSRERPDLSSQSHRDVMEYIIKEEYGHGLSYREMCVLADYYSDVMVTVYTGLSLAQKIKLRYIKRII